MFRNKRISIPKGIAIILLAFLICGGIAGWQYGWFLEEEEVRTLKIAPQQIKQEIQEDLREGEKN